MFASWLHGWMLVAVLLAPTYAEPLKKRTYADYGYQQVNGGKSTAHLDKTKLTRK
jgi:hypothetical protein